MVTIAWRRRPVSYAPGAWESAATRSRLTMLMSEYIRDFDTFISRVEGLAGPLLKANKLCSLRAVADEGKNVFSVLVVDTSKRKKERTLSYGNIELIADLFPSSELISRLRALNKGELRIKDRMLRFQMNGGIEVRTERSRSDFHQWPGWLFTLGYLSQPYNLSGHGPLVGAEGEPYFDLVDAVKSWTGTMFWQNDSRAGKILLFIPRFEGKIDDLEIVEEKLVVRTTARVKGLRVAVLAAGQEEGVRKVVQATKVNAFPLPLNPTRLLVFLINSEGEWIDSFEETDSSASWPNRVLFAGAKYSKALAETIRQGETDTVEFKPYIRPKDKKVAEILQTIIAFANTKGGLLIFGVSDHAEVLGVDHEEPHDAKRGKAFPEDYFDWIRKLVKDNLNRIPGLDMKKETVGDKTVLLVKVGEGNTKPYFNFHTKEVFVRRGANNVRPDPEAQLQQRLSGQIFP